jgi:DNA-binding NtrC family response regulator
MERAILLHKDHEVKPDMLQLGGQSRLRREAHSIGAQIDALLAAPMLPEGGIDFEKLVEEVERALITKAYLQTEENQSRTAEILNVKRDKLRYRMKQFGMKDDDSPRIGHA